MSERYFADLSTPFKETVILFKVGIPEGATHYSYFKNGHIADWWKINGDEYFYFSDVCSEWIRCSTKPKLVRIERV